MTVLVANYDREAELKASEADDGSDPAGDGA